MKKSFFITITIILFSLLIPLYFAFAESQGEKECKNIINNKNDCITCVDDKSGAWLKNKIPGLPQCIEYGKIGGLKNSLFVPLYKFALGALAVTSLVMVVIGGYQYLTALGGNRAAEAKKTLTFAIGGLVLGLCSVLILNIVNKHLTVGYYNPLRLQFEIQKAMEAIKNQAELERLSCVNPPDDPCNQKTGGDICTTDTGASGYCERDVNVDGSASGYVCTCKANNCANNCSGTDCVGKRCGEVDKRCMLNSTGTVVCMSKEEVCGQGDCGAGQASKWANLECSGPYPCHTTTITDGLCMNPGYVGEQLCKPKSEVCGDCGASYASYVPSVRDKIYEKCNSYSPCNSPLSSDMAIDKTFQCLNGSCAIDSCQGGIPVDTVCLLGSQLGYCQSDGSCQIPTPSEGCPTLGQGAACETSSEQTGTCQCTSMDTATCHCVANSSGSTCQNGYLCLKNALQGVCYNNQCLIWSNDSDHTACAPNDSSGVCMFPGLSNECALAADSCTIGVCNNGICDNTGMVFIHDYGPNPSLMEY